MGLETGLEMGLRLGLGLGFRIETEVGDCFCDGLQRPYALF